MGVPLSILKSWADATDCAAPARDKIRAELRRGGPGGRSFAARPPAARGLVGGDRPVSCVVPVRIVSTPNERVHRQVAARLVRHQRNLIALFVGRIVLPAPPAVVRLTRVYAPRLRQRPLDSDNLQAGCKGARDQIADLYGLTDARDSGLSWEYGADEPGDAAGLRIEVKAVRP